MKQENLKKKIAKIEIKIEKISKLILKRTQLNKFKSNAVHDLQDKINNNLILLQRKIKTKNFNCNDWNSLYLIENNID